MLLPENIKFSYDNLNASYFNCTYHFLFMMHNLRRGLVHCSPTFWVNNIHRKRMDYKIIIFLWNKWEGPLLLQTRVWPITQGNGIFKTESVLNSRHRDKLLKEKNVTITAHQQRRITTFLALSLFMLQINQGLYKWVSTMTLKRGYNRSGNSNVSCT